MFIVAYRRGQGDLMVAAEAPSTRLTDKQTSVYWWLTVGDGGLDGGGRGPQHQTNRLVFMGGLPSGTRDLMVAAEAPSTRLTD